MEREDYNKYVGEIKGRCVLCGEKIKPHELRCYDCRKEVNRELNNKQNKPLDYYFQYFKSYLQNRCQKEHLY